MTRIDRGEIPPDESAHVRSDVTDAGALRGHDTVQLYVRDLVGSVTTPVKRLRGFAKVAFQPGESRAVEFSLGPAALAQLEHRLR